MKHPDRIIGRADMIGSGKVDRAVNMAYAGAAKNKLAGEIRFREGAGDIQFTACPGNNLDGAAALHRDSSLEVICGSIIPGLDVATRIRNICGAEHGQRDVGVESEAARKGERGLTPSGWRVQAEIGGVSPGGKTGKGNAAVIKSDRTAE